MRSPPGEPQKEKTDSLAGEVGLQGIEALPSRVSRYGKAKTQALDLAQYMAGVPGLQRMADTVSACGDYLVFRHYTSVDQVRLHGARLCKRHLLCSLCAIRRGAKALKAYLDRWERIKAEHPSLRAFLVTLTVKNGDDLAERMKHLQRAQHELWKRKQRGRGSVLDGVAGAVWSYEVKRGSGSGLWHPHLHMIALAEQQPDAVHLADEWKAITGDSHIVDVRPVDQVDPVSGFIEVFKYAVKFSEQPPEDTVHAWRTLAGKRLLASAGCFRAVKVPEDLLDDAEGLEGLPYVDLFYRYLGKGYSLKTRARGVQGSPRPARVSRWVAPAFDEQRAGRSEAHRRLLDEHLFVHRIKPGRRSHV